MSDTFDPGEGWTQVPAHEGIGKDRIVRIDSTDIARQAWVRNPVLPTEAYTTIRVRWKNSSPESYGTVFTYNAYGSWYNRGIDMWHADLASKIESFEILAVPVSED